MMATGTSTATNGNGVDVSAGSVVGPVGMVVGPVDGGDVDNEIEVGSALGIPTS